MLFRAALLLACAGVALAAPFIQHDTAAITVNETGKPNWAWNQPLVEFARDLSRVAYCDADKIQNWSCDVCGKDFTLKTVIDGPSNPDRLQVFVGHSVGQKLIVVSWRGSTNIPNWIVNLQFSKVDSDFNDRGCTDCKIHKGFLEAYQRISPPVIAAVLELAAQFPDFVILTTGHSLGGAMAVHSALDLCVNHNLTHRLDMITFGQPRLGNEEFAKFCIDIIPQATRVVHENDIVPHLPFKEGFLAFDFHHNAREVWNTDDAETIKVCDGSGEDESCSKSVPLLKYSIPDHLWYFGAPHGCDSDSKYSVADVLEMQRVQAQIIDRMMAAQQQK